MKDWGNPALVAINREAHRSFTVPYENAETALGAMEHAAEFYHLLNGVWKFAFYDYPEAAPEDFFKADYDCDAWDDITVPGHWQLQGYSHPHTGRTIQIRNAFQTIPQ